MHESINTLYMRFLIFAGIKYAFIPKGQNYSKTQTAAIASAIEDGTVQSHPFSDVYRCEALNLKNSTTILEKKPRQYFFLKFLVLFHLRVVHLRVSI